MNEIARVGDLAKVLHVTAMGAAGGMAERKRLRRAEAGLGHRPVLMSPQFGRT